MTLSVIMPRVPQAAGDPLKEAALQRLLLRTDAAGLLERKRVLSVHDLAVTDGRRALFARIGDALIEIHTLTDDEGRAVVRVVSDFAVELTPSEDFFQRMNGVNVLFPESAVGVRATGPGSALVDVRCSAATVGALINERSIERCVQLVHSLANMLLRQGVVRLYGGRSSLLRWAERLNLPVPELEYPDVY